MCHKQVFLPLVLLIYRPHEALWKTPAEVSILNADSLRSLAAATCILKWHLLYLSFISLD